MDPRFDEFIDRTATDSMKWSGREAIYENKNAIPMWVADMDFPAPQPVIDALTTRIQHGIYGYGGLPDDYYQTVQHWLQKRHGWPVETEWLTHAPGVLAAFAYILSLVTNPDDSVVIQTPVYHPFKKIITNLGRTPVTNSLKVENGQYVMDLENLEEILQSGVKVVVLCSPHNPVGRVWTRDELRSFGELCEKYDAFVIADEIHSDLILPGFTHTPYASLGGELTRRSVTFVAPSKTFNLAGFHAAIAIIPDEKLRKQYIATLDKFHIGRPDILAKVALQTAYQEGEPWLEGLLQYIDENIKYLDKTLHSRIPQISLTKPQGTYLVWLDCRKLGLSQEELKSFMTHTAGIALNEGSMFGEEGTGFMRMNLACPRMLLEKALAQLESAVKELSPSF
ncbi:MalY/PatB family protein [Alicyclobacillus sp. SO9]|uniref:MalY/PatB family protein n=1 Tax=Alicyclobacillus sp. SO9 TaxID=2665646 RepID=UPI0018E8B687|nr:MalY/PatB family protein [Alicyclobacillus sp. SO9]QQE80297.1 pyridoxal phosphate-dependent aminotransferase [Alicyclobacillus sp. SO9]